MLIKKRFVIYVTLQNRKKLPYSVSTNRALKPFDIIHMDIWSPYSVPTIHGFRYVLTIVDDYSRFTWIVMLKHKSEVQSHLKRFVTLAENQYDAKVKVIRTDNGPEFLLHSYYGEKGIIHPTSCVETPEQNSRVERRHQYLLNIARALLFQSSLPKQFWGHAIHHAVYLMNRVPSKVVGDISPYQALHKSLPDLNQLKVFGCLC